MMHLKTYENNKNKPKSGDYVYVELEDNSYEPGRIIRIKQKRRTYPYVVSYENDDKERIITEDELIAFSKNIEDLDIYIKSIKYNI